MTTDQNKHIDLIKYNHLNLPIEIQFGNGKIYYTYDAAGTKLKKQVHDGGTITRTDYVSGYQYKDNVLQFFPTVEGYVNKEATGYKYVYNYTDHLGNVRLSYADNDGNGSIDTSEILEENNYYAFGLKHNGYNNATSANEAYKYKYNGKEYQNELGLDWYDLGARNLGSDIGRFHNTDPLAEDYNFQSPYAFANNNPVALVDVDGMGVEDDFKYATDGKITLVKKTTDSTDRLIAENGDIISDDISKGILKDNINIKKDGLTLEGDVKLNARVGELMTRISVYEQVEISWGFYSINDAYDGVVNILPYENNKIDICDALSSNFFYKGKNYDMDFQNHTHPGLWGKNISGEWVKDRGGSTKPSDIDRSLASRSKYGGFIWGRYGVSHYNSKGVINKESYSYGLIRNYRDNNTVINRDYIKNTLKWKKDFSKPPAY